MNIDHSEILFKAMAHKDDASVNEVSYLLVGGLESGQVSVRDTWVKVTWFDPRVLGKVIYNLQGTKTDRGSYMSAHVLLNLINEMGKRDKMQGLSSILSLFLNEFDKFNKTRA